MAEFDKSKVYTALNADEVKVGSKGLFANNLDKLEDLVKHCFHNYECIELKDVKSSAFDHRFGNNNLTYYNLFYLIKEPEGKKAEYRPDIYEMEIKTIEVSGWQGAIMALRMPYESNKSDSIFSNKHGFNIGDKDLELCRKLIRAGSDHRKFLRFINVHTVIKAPLYWWKQFDTYKIGTTASSSSTMHLLAKRLLHESDFTGMHGTDDLEYIARLNSIIAKYSEEKSPDVKAQYELDLFARLPQGYMQKRIVSMNYEVLYNIYNQRKGHKLSEWQEFREWVETLPYWNELFEFI